MNEIDWIAGADPLAMLDHMGAGASDRKLRLFACACVRRFWSDLRYPTPREAVAMAERLAEGTATPEEVEAMRVSAEASAGNAPEFEQFAYTAAAATLMESAPEAARTARESMRQQAVRTAAYEMIFAEDEAAAVARASEEESRRQVELLNELFGNPFRPVAVEPHWLAWGGGIVVGMAREIEEAQRFAELPYLADALMDAGCDQETLLRHLRQPEGHIRGCWALDALLR
jgi:hypothetical protein